MSVSGVNDKSEESNSAQWSTYGQLRGRTFIQSDSPYPAVQTIVTELLQNNGGPPRQGTTYVQSTLSDMLSKLEEGEASYIEKTYPNGDKYEGGWLNNKREGHGVMTYHNGEIYEGKWVNDKREDPEGILQFPNGGKIEGNWEDDHLEGKCIYTMSNGKGYPGIYKDGMLQESLT